MSDYRIRLRTSLLVNHRA